MKNIFFNIAAIDPGRSKWGVAILDHRGEILFRAIYPIELFSHTFGLLCDKYSCKLAVLGNQTNHLYFQKLIADLNIPCELIDERFSSEEARKLFFNLEPVQGWRKLLPGWLLYPHRDYDDVSAVVLGRRYLELGN
jgi:RNase H-fold protein (predicted Holliday junction resolvase)